MPPFPRGLVFPASAAIPMPKMSPHEMYALAREIAMGINDLQTIIANNSLTEAQYERIRENGTFQRILDIEIQAWSAAKNTPDRVRIEAAATFEQLMPALFARLMNDRENLNHVVEGGKLLAKVAGIDQSDQRPDLGEKFIINIDMGGEKLSLTRNAKPVAADTPLLKLDIGEPPKD